jgi:hypothetical protein
MEDDGEFESLQQYQFMHSSLVNHIQSSRIFNPPSLSIEIFKIILNTKIGKS